MNEPLPASYRAFGRLLPLQRRAINRSLGRIERLLNALGNPEDMLPPVVHVTGTKGKGSTVAIMRACLEAAGYRAHIYTSPHLVRYHERIRPAGQMIEEHALLAAIEECERANRGAPITLIEVTTAAAFLTFARTPADIVLLEVGVGGRLDSTNVIRHPAVTAITPVSLDHQDEIGDTVTAIAGEKAGIIKSGAPAVIAPQPPDAAAVIEACAAAVSAPLYRAEREWRCEAVEGGMRYVGEHWQFDLPRPSLLGAHQIVNAGVALSCLEQLRGFSLSRGALAKGLRDIDWPARLQLLSRGSLVAMLPPDWEVWLDGGHNPAAGAALGAVAADWRDRPLYLVVGMVEAKDAAGFLAPLARHASRLWAVTIPDQNDSLPAAAIAAAAQSVGMPARECQSVAAALRDIIAAEAPGRVLICGSLHLAGRVLSENG